MIHQPAAERFARHEAVPPARSLSALEQRVAMLARRDADRGMVEPARSPLARFMRMLTGVEGPQPLADERLEALRRFVAFARRGDRRARDIAAELLRRGFSAEALAGAEAIARA